MPIQGTASDIVKIAMLHVEEELKRISSKARLLMQVHDELLLEVPEAEVEGVSKLLKHEMESAVSLDVPLVADVGVGDNWMDAKP
jgi:DNA polymerase-1